MLISDFKLHRLLLLTLVLVFVSCNGLNQKADELPDYVIDRVLFTRLLTDVHIIEAVIIQQQSEGLNTADLAQIYYDSLFAKYEVNKTQLDSSLAYYSRSPELFSLIYSDVITNLLRLESGPGEEIEQPEKSVEDSDSLNNL